MSFALSADADAPEEDSPRRFCARPSEMEKPLKNRIKVPNRNHWGKDHPLGGASTFLFINIDFGGDKETDS